MRDYATLQTALSADLEIPVGTDIPITSDMGHELAARVSLARSFFKKLAPSGNSKDADQAALIKFKAVNSALSTSFQFGATNEVEHLFYDYFCNHLNSCLEPREDVGCFDLNAIRETMKTGPGAAQKANSETVLSKLFESSLSYTDESLIRYYRAALSETGFWADAEMLRNQKFGFVRVKGGKIFFAPKNSEISRTCCTPANVNLLIQMAVGAFIEFRLGWYFGISLSTQPDKNRVLARLGSLCGSFGTTDLSSASDSMGLSMIQRSLRPSFLKTMMMLSRDECAVLPDGTELTLNMISTMGNGFTFPLQTVIFSSAVLSVYQLMGFPSKADDGSNLWGVFGDDIIVRKECYAFLNRMLNKLGFVVNDDKSFNTGPFRESCGHDYYDGFNVRGVYVKSLETPQEVYSLINRLTRWSTLHDYPLDRAVRLLMSWVRDIRIPYSEQDDAGIKVPFMATKPVVDARYWFSYRCFIKRLRRRTVVEPDSAECVNPFGTAVCYLAGYARRRDHSITTDDIPRLGQLEITWPKDWNAAFTLRERVGERSRYKIVARSIPYWDYFPTTKTESDTQVWDEWRIDLTIDRHADWGRRMLGLVPSGD